ncbi:MAG: transketolase [Spirochaetia bacterium]
MDKRTLDAIALSIRSLSIDAIEAANSGHPGIPLGLAELGAWFFGEMLSHQPTDPHWINRDRFILSAGHGSMWLYALLHLSGYAIPLENIKKFRQLGAKVPGHPEYPSVPGVNMSTGPLAEGIASAVGFAIAQTMQAARFNKPGLNIFDHYTYVLAGDGCLMEGVSYESASLAGHLKLGKLIVFYDSNTITIDGRTQLTFTEDIPGRYTSMGWQVLHADAYDYESLRRAMSEAQSHTSAPSLIIVKSIIGHGSPNKADSADAHGAPLGEKEASLTKANLGLDPQQPFYIDPLALEGMQARSQVLEEKYTSWSSTYTQWQKQFPDLALRLQSEISNDIPDIDLCNVDLKQNIATRVCSGQIIQQIAQQYPALIAGSADLFGSNNTYIKNGGDYSAQSLGGRNIFYGVREHAMAAITNGLNLYGGLRAYGSTFLVFSDHMRPSIRLAAIMKLPSIFVFTHDSFYVGEDGPTHQPVEHIESFRLIPHVCVLRPADGEETALAWNLALQKNDGPSILCLTRQKVQHIEKPAHWEKQAQRGAYIVHETQENPHLILVSTGSEVTLVLAVQRILHAQGISSRCVSVLSRDLLLEQDTKFIQTLIPNKHKAIAIEAGSAGGWFRLCDHVFGIEQFGRSGKPEDLCEYLGFTAQHLATWVGNKYKELSRD